MWQLQSRSASFPLLGWPIKLACLESVRKRGLFLSLPAPPKKRSASVAADRRFLESRLASLVALGPSLSAGGRCRPPYPPFFLSSSAVLVAPGLILAGASRPLVALLLAPCKDLKNRIKRKPHVGGFGKGIRKAAPALRATQAIYCKKFGGLFHRQSNKSTAKKAANPYFFCSHCGRAIAMTRPKGRNYFIKMPCVRALHAYASLRRESHPPVARGRRT